MLGTLEGLGASQGANRPFYDKLNLSLIRQSYHFPYNHVTRKGKVEGYNIRKAIDRYSQKSELGKLGFL